MADLYDLTPQQLMTIEGFGAKSAERVIAGIDASKDVPFERVVFALSIPFVGETTARKVARAAKNIDTLMSMPVEQLEAIEDVGARIAASIAGFFADEQNRRMVERLRAAGLKMEAKTSVLFPRRPIMCSPVRTWARRNSKKLLNSAFPLSERTIFSA